MSSGGRIAAGSASLAVAAVLALAWVFVARAVGPSDICEYVQGRTMAYTTDIVLNGRWVLPRHGETGATKPPLFNWLAAPAVAVFGFASEAAHKSPSAIAAVACWALLVRTGRRIGDGAAPGWVAALIFCCNYAIFKLAWLARPDMLLTLWVGLGWVAATAQLVDPDAPGGRRRQVIFWMCVAAAALTKGPPAGLLLVYGAIAVRPLAGSWSATALLGWRWGLPLAIGVVLAWLTGAALADPVHVRDRLIVTEIIGRVTGLGPEGAEGRGPFAIVQDAGYMPAYFLTRFAPWSLPAVWGLVLLVRNRRETGTPGTAWMRGAAMFIAVTVVFFSLSAGKRGDYIAPCLVPASLLAAWTLARAGGPVLGHPATIIIAAAATLATHTVARFREVGPGQGGCGDAVHRLVAATASEVRGRPAPVVFWQTRGLPLQPLLGYSTPEGWPPIHERMLAGGPFYVVAGRHPVPPETFEAYFHREIQRDHAWPHTLREIDRVAGHEGDRPFAFLYRVDPGASLDEATGPGDPGP